MSYSPWGQKESDMTEQHVPGDSCTHKHTNLTLSTSNPSEILRILGIL